MTNKRTTKPQCKCDDQLKQLSSDIRYDHACTKSWINDLRRDNGVLAAELQAVKTLLMQFSEQIEKHAAEDRQMPVTIKEFCGTLQRVSRELNAERKLVRELLTQINEQADDGQLVTDRLAPEGIS